MALRVDKLGTRYGPRTSVLDVDHARRYAAATNDPNPVYASGSFAPPVFGVVPTWDVLGLAAVDLVPAEALPFVVHGEQDMHFHQPLVPGSALTTTSTAHSVRFGGSGARLTIEVHSLDEAETPVLTQYVTLFVRNTGPGTGDAAANAATDGTSAAGSAGPDKPGHGFPAAARESPLGAMTLHVDEDQTYRYRDASGDRMPIHVDEAFARSVGLPGIVVHGLCTMAMCSHAVLALAAQGDPARLRRLAVRFSASVFPGNDLVVGAYDAGTTADGIAAVAFEAHSAGAVVIKHGWAEVAA